MAHRTDIDHAWFWGREQGGKEEGSQMEVTQDVGPKLKVVIIFGKLFDRCCHHATMKDDGSQHAIAVQG